MTEEHSADWHEGLRYGQRAARFAMANRLLAVQGQAALTGDFAADLHDQVCTTSQQVGEPCRVVPCFCWCHRPYFIPA